MILISACLAGIPCRMDGQSKECPGFRELVERGEAVMACPEVLGGLPTPRPRSEKRGDQVISERGEDVTAYFEAGAQKALALYREKGCTLAVLKSKSPSCGLGRIHAGSFDGRMTDGNGVFADLLLKEGIPVTDELHFSGAGTGKVNSE